MKIWFNLINKRKLQPISNHDVDLSDDRVFEQGIRGIKQVGNNFYYQETGLVHTGSVKTIKEKSFCDSFCDGKTCDCCGRSISPLSFETLCSECIARMAKDDLYEGVFVTNKEKQAILNKVWFIEQKI